MRVEQFALADWDRELRVNLTAPMILAHQAAGVMRALGGGCIVNLCDEGTGRPWTGRIAYIVSKGGLETLTRVLARALAPHIRVVGVAPGVAIWPDDMPQDERARLLQRIPLRRAGTPEDVASLVHFLITEGEYIDGEIIRVDGGRHLR